MEINNKLYKNIGIHVISSIFTVEKGVTKILLIKRNNEPYRNMWALIGGALYNNETILDGATREIKEKTGIENISLYYSGYFDKIDRSPLQRMIAISFIGVIDSSRVSILNRTLKTLDCDWYPINNIPVLAYDFNDIVSESIESLKKLIENTDILKSLFPNGFTIPELQKTMEAILDKEYDRRNFRKKLLTNGLIEDTKKATFFEGNKPAKIYKFK